MDSFWRDDDLVEDALKRFVEKTGIVVGPPSIFATSSSHSIFYTAASNIGDLMVKLCVDTFLAARQDALNQEFLTLRIASEAGLAPCPHYVDEGARVLIQEFIAGSTGRDWSLSGLRPCINLAALLMTAKPVGSMLRTAHLSYKQDLERSRHVLEWVVQNDSSLLALAKSARDRLPWLMTVTSGAQPVMKELPLVLSHNDVSPENTVTGGDGRVILIDFETAALSRPDFLFGQLAVDVAIQDFLEGRPVRGFTEICNAVHCAVSDNVSPLLQRARTLERLMFNAAYGLRQVASRNRWRHESDYVERKLAVAQWCIAALDASRDEMTSMDDRERGETRE